LVTREKKEKPKRQILHPYNRHPLASALSKLISSREGSTMFTNGEFEAAPN
jgi:hypothetical protein